MTFVHDSDSYNRYNILQMPEEMKFPSMSTAHSTFKGRKAIRHSNGVRFGDLESPLEVGDEITMEGVTNGDIFIFGGYTTNGDYIFTHSSTGLNYIVSKTGVCSQYEVVSIHINPGSLFRYNISEKKNLDGHYELMDSRENVYYTTFDLSQENINDMKDRYVRGQKITGNIIKLKTKVYKCDVIRGGATLTPYSVSNQITQIKGLDTLVSLSH